MTKEEIEVFSHACNSAVVRMPERGFPGVVIQGDSLSILFDDLMTAVERIEGKVDRETFLTILDMAEAIERHLFNYEQTLKSHEMELPYVRDPERSTAKYRHYWEEE